MSKMTENNTELDELYYRPKTKSDKIIDTILEWTETIVLAVFAVILIFTFLVRIVSVNGPSMMNTLYDKDVLILSSFMYEAEQGDIVVIESSSFESTIVKRIIATAGQTVEINYNSPDGCIVSVDGEVLDESYIAEPMYDTHSNSPAFYDAEKGVYRYEVPYGKVFVMGDNRNHSSDSRMIGFVDENEIVGEVVFRMYSSQGEIGRINN
ncbi:MAG: signal peptidase I [Oscillospiraceae bacterium]|nr:signal peptidase I [Oscillospiraceae bacterium]